MNEKMKSQKNAKQVILVRKDLEMPNENSEQCVLMLHWEHFLNAD